jgi:hypothetical protein
VIGAIVGGGLKVVNVELPLVQSPARQALLAGVGAILIVGSFVLRPNTPIDRGSGSSGPNSGQPSGGVVVPTFPTFPQPPAPGRVETLISLSRTSGPAGTQLSVSGSGFSAGETVIIRFRTNEVGRVTADSNGAISNAAARVPTDWRFQGQHDFVAQGLTSGRWGTAPFQVT